MRNVEATGDTHVTKLDVRQWPRTVNEVGSPAHRTTLQQWVRAPTTPQRVVLRSRIILLSLDGFSNQDIAGRLAVSRTTVRLWRKRFAMSGPAALLHDAPGRGRHPRMTAASMHERLREANLLGPDSRPLSMRRAAEALGVSATSVWRALKKPSLPRPLRTSKSSQDI